MTDAPLHPSLERFLATLDEMRELSLRKQRDYGSSKDPFANVRASEDFGLDAWVGAAVRINDKMRRIQRAAQGAELANESLEDSFLDMAVYAAIAVVLLREQWDGEKSDPTPMDEYRLNPGAQYTYPGVDSFGRLENVIPFPGVKFHTGL